MEKCVISKYQALEFSIESRLYLIKMPLTLQKLSLWKIGKGITWKFFENNRMNRKKDFVINTKIIV